MMQISKTPASNNTKKTASNNKLAQQTEKEKTNVKQVVRSKTSAIETMDV